MDAGAGGPQETIAGEVVLEKVLTFLYRHFGITFSIDAHDVNALCGLAASKWNQVRLERRQELHGGCGQIQSGSWSLKSSGAKPCAVGAFAHTIPKSRPGGEGTGDKTSHPAEYGSGAGFASYCLGFESSDSGHGMRCLMQLQRTQDWSLRARVIQGFATCADME